MHELKILCDHLAVNFHITFGVNYSNITILDIPHPYVMKHRSDRWSPSLRMTGDTGPLSDFIEGLGPGQLVGRQVLGAPALGDIQLSMHYQKGSLEVEVIRARGLQVRIQIFCVIME